MNELWMKPFMMSSKQKFRVEWLGTFSIEKRSERRHSNFFLWRLMFQKLAFWDFFGEFMSETSEAQKLSEHSTVSARSNEYFLMKMCFLTSDKLFPCPMFNKS